MKRGKEYKDPKILSRAALTTFLAYFSENPLYYTSAVSMLIFITTHYWFWSKKGRETVTYLIGLGFVVSVI